MAHFIKNIRRVSASLLASAAPTPRARPSRPHFSRSLARGCFILFIYFEDRLLDLLMSASIFLVSNPLIRLYLYPSCSRGFTLLFCFPSLCRMFSAFIIRLSCSVIKAFKVVNSPPALPKAGSADMQSLFRTVVNLLSRRSIYSLT